VRGRGGGVWDGEVYLWNSRCHLAEPGSARFALVLPSFSLSPPPTLTPRGAPPPPPPPRDRCSLIVGDRDRIPRGTFYRSARGRASLIRNSNTLFRNRDKRKRKMGLSKGLSGV